MRRRETGWWVRGGVKDEGGRVGSALVPGICPVWRCQLSLRSLYNRYEDNEVICGWG